MLKNFAVAIFVLCVASCSSMGTVKVQGVDLPLTQIQTVVDQALPLGRRDISPNGREFFSNYFLPGGKKIVAAKDSSYRMYAQVKVLGDRRPYNIEVTVHRERKKNSQYERVGSDERTAKVLAKRIQNELNKRRGDRNIIDDFRVF